MPRNGSGGYTPPSNSWSPALNGASATATDWNATLTDVAAAIQQSISADGQTTITGNLQMGGNKLTNLAAGSAAGQSVRFEQLFGQGSLTDIASASITDIGAPLTNFLRVTGTTGIASFGTNYNGPKFLIFADAVTLTNSASLVLPGNANITTSVNDAMIAIPISGGWQVVSYQRAASVPADALRNIVINGGFQINQRAVSGTVTLTSGQYGHDRWKAGASGCTYTFATSNNVTTITITAGTLQQVVEGLNVYSGSHVLSWSGTAQGRINSGAYGATGVSASLTGGTNTTVEFGLGTLSNVLFERGSIATVYSTRPIGMELQLCQRYYWVGGYGWSGQCISSTNGTVSGTFPVPMRATPTFAAISGAGTNALIRSGGANETIISSVNSGVDKNGAWYYFGGSGYTTGAAYTIIKDFFTASAEL